MSPDASIKPLPLESLSKACDPNQFSFKSTAELEPLEDLMGQQRAIQAVRFAVNMDQEGYNLFAYGPQGTGKRRVIRRYLEMAAKERPVPSDWVYVNNFDEPHRPRCISLSPGQSLEFKEDMDNFIEDVRAAIPSAFEDEEYRKKREEIEEEFKERPEQAFEELSKKAEQKNVALLRTPTGFALAPVKNGEVIKPEVFDRMAKEDQDRWKKDIEELQEELKEILEEAPKWGKELRDKIKELNREVVQGAVGHLLAALAEKYKDNEKITEYLEDVSEHVIKHANDFIVAEMVSEGASAAMGSPNPMMQMQAQRNESLVGGDPFRVYRVNIIVDNCHPEEEQPKFRRRDHAIGIARQLGTPVVYEENPSHPNLVGRIEHIAQFGALVTDFNMIQGGALHRANGGYLVMDARKVLSNPYAWEALKRALQTKRIKIESPAEAMGWVSTVSLQPEPIDLDVKIILLGDPYLYMLLNHYDPEFSELFKVAADFDDRMERTDLAADQYARFIRTVVEENGLRHLDRTGVARVVDYGARYVSDSERLSTDLTHISDLVREADYWAKEEGAKEIIAVHVDKAVEAKIERSDRIRDRMQEEIIRETINIATDGATVGEVNGLAVLGVNHFMFGKPTRISARVRMGKGDVVDIEREVALSGPLHSKGVLILSSFLSSRYAQKKPLSLDANLVFEQSYGGVDGDSASSTELYALMSALSEIPIKQGFAVTGSVDQYGRVQAIGGVNEKIEGFFEVCKARGLTGDQGVLIPSANVKHLMLNKDVLKAVEDGKFNIYPVETIDQGIEILTGVPAGERDKDGNYPINSVNRAVEARLDGFSKAAIRIARQMEGARESIVRKQRPRRDED